MRDEFACRLHRFKSLARHFAECARSVFFDFSQLTTVAVRGRHVFEFARKRAEQFTGVEPVRTALFSDTWAAFGIACFYESLLENTLIEARAFRDLAEAAELLAIPVDVLTLKDEPAPPKS